MILGYQPANMKTNNTCEQIRQEEARGTISVYLQLEVLLWFYHGKHENNTVYHHVWIQTIRLFGD